MAITFLKSERIILITAPQTVVTIQELLNACRDYEDEWYSMDIPHLVNASGKEDLGGGVLVGITLELLDNWRVKFEDRCEYLCDSPSVQTADFFVQCSIAGGNIVAINDYDNSAVAASGCTQVTITSSSSATIIGISDLQTATADAVWDKIANRSAVVPGSYGDELLNIEASADVDAIADAVWEETAADHTDGTTMGGKLNAASAGGVDYDALADAVWDEDITTHTDADSAGEKLEEASQGGDPNTTADAVWDKLISASEQVPGSYGSEISEISANMGTISDEALYSLSTIVDAPIAGFLTTRFTMIDGETEDDTYENCIIALQDQTDNHIEMRRISAYVGATRQVTVDRAFSFDVANGDIISISKLSYGGATGTGSTSYPRLDD